MRVRLIVCAVLALACAAWGAGYHWRLPKGLAPPPAVAGPVTPAKVELGRQLFYDADLSADGTMSCATCHEQKHAFTDTNRIHPGVTGQNGRRNVMSLANAGYFSALTWGDPRLRTLEDQSLVPIEGEHPVEMGMAGKADVLTARLARDACYRRLFATAFPEDDGAISMADVSRALAAFERTLTAFDAPYDRYARGDAAAISPAARRGAALFYGPLGCVGCHAGPAFTDAARPGGRPQDAFHDIGLYARAAYPVRDRGLAEITGAAEDVGRFRTPSLRNAALTAPYMHDGSVATLAEAIGQHHVAGLTPPSDAQTADLVAFLAALSDPRLISDPSFSLPKSRCGKRR